MYRTLSLLFVFYVSAIPAASAVHRDIDYFRREMVPTPVSDVGLYLAWTKDCDYSANRNNVVNLLTREQAALKEKDFSEFKRGFDIYRDYRIRRGRACCTPSKEVLRFYKAKRVC